MSRRRLGKYRDFQLRDPDWTDSYRGHLIRRAVHGLPIEIIREKQMTNKIALCLLSLSLGITSWAHAAEGTAEKAVAALEDQWTQSERTNNPDLVAPLLADKLIVIDSDGSIGNRTKFLADAKAIKYSSVDIEGLHITVFGRTAVATMVLKAKGTDEKGKPMDVKERWADTWVKMPDGKWQCVLSQGSDLKK